MAATSKPNSVSETATNYYNNACTFVSSFVRGCAKQAQKHWAKVDPDTQKAVLNFSKPLPGVASIAICPLTGVASAVTGAASAAKLLPEKVTGFMVKANTRIIQVWERSTPTQRVVVVGAGAVASVFFPKLLCVPASYLAGKMGADHVLGNNARAAQTNAAPSQPPIDAPAQASIDRKVD